MITNLTRENDAVTRPARMQLPDMDYEKLFLIVVKVFLKREKLFLYPMKS